MPFPVKAPLREVLLSSPSMAHEKIGAKGGSFFHLFDWNKKSRKKLFSGGNGSHESGSNHRTKKSEDNNIPPASRVRLIDEDELVGMVSFKGSSDFSCASSVTDEDCGRSKAPGVVARLMGLDSLPTSVPSDQMSTPSFDSRPLQDDQMQKRSPEFCINDLFSNVRTRTDSYRRKPAELRSQKMPSSPIERFQAETLTAKTVKPLPINHYKLLSPIKNPGFISPKNAADILEAAAKIIESQTSRKVKTPVFGSSPAVHLKVRESKDSAAQSKRTSNIPESSRRQTEMNGSRYLRGKSLDKSWSGVDDGSFPRTNGDKGESNPMRKGKPVSLAVEAKTNLQKREGGNTPNRSTKVSGDHEDCKLKLDQPFKCQPNGHKSKQPKKAPAANNSGVFRQNNQKQNCSSSKERLHINLVTANQHARKTSSGDLSSTKNNSVSKLQGDTNIIYDRECLETSDLEKVGSSSSNRNFPRKKRMVERSLSYEKSGFMDTMLVDRQEQHVRPNIVIDEQSSWKEDKKRNGVDVVSFTFTSPMIKSIPRPHSSNHMASNGNGKTVPSLGQNALSGDDLGHLLEQKLKELTSRTLTHSSNFARSSLFDAPIFSTEETSSSFDSLGSPDLKHEKDFRTRSCGDDSHGIFYSGSSTGDSQACETRRQLKELERIEFRSHSDAQVAGGQHLSILESAFSNESCTSSGSSCSTDATGGKMHESIHAPGNLGLTFKSKERPGESEIEITDSATSTLSETRDGVDSGTKARFDGYKHEREYIKEILFSACNLARAGEALDPLLFDELELERSKSGIPGLDKESRISRRLLFDCVNECLDLKCGRFFCAGYRAWVKGASMVRSDLVDELFDEISRWKGMGDWMVDELVDRDMSGHVGKWVDFEAGAFEIIGVDMEDEILDCLVDEMVSDLANKEARADHQVAGFRVAGVA